MGPKKEPKYTQKSLLEVWETKKQTQLKVESAPVHFGCPVCCFDLSRFTLEARTVHVNRCVDLPAKGVKIEEESTVEIKKEDADVVVETRVATRTRKLKSSPKSAKQSSKRIKREKACIPEHKILQFEGEANVLAADAFCYAPHESICVYLLTHFHADHYGGMSKSWFDIAGARYLLCTPVTGKLVKARFGIGPNCTLLETPLGSWVDIPDTDIQVLALDANHCPGAGIFVVRCHGVHYLHCGDFRACAPMVRQLQDYTFERCYLDTTYLDPKYAFPKQDEVVRHTAQWVKDKLASYKSFQQRILDYVRADNTASEFLVVVGTYSIGKERLALGIAQALNTKIYCSKERLRTMSTFDWPELAERLDTCSPLSCQVHLVPMTKMKKDTMLQYLKGYSSQFKSVLVIHPTGWTFNWRAKAAQQDTPKLEDIVEQNTGTQMDVLLQTLDAGFNANSKQGFVTYRKVVVPYSEHSSFRELFYFVNLLKCRQWITTVNKSNDQSQMEWLDAFSRYSELKLTMM